MKLFQRMSVRTLILSLIITIIVAILIIQHNQKKANTIVALYANIVQHTLSSLIDLSIIPEGLFISGEQDITQEEFSDLASYMHKLQSFEFFSYTPKSSVQFVFPYEDNKHLIGTSGFFKEDEARLSQIALSSNETLLYTYNDTKSREKWLILKNPIIYTSKMYTEDFRGFITLAYSLQSIIPTMGFDQIEQLGYNYRLQLIEDENPVLIHKSKRYSDIFSIHKTIDMGGSTWVLSLSIPFMMLVNPLLLLLIFLSLRCVYYMFVYTRQKKLTIKKQLNYELYVDSLTGVYNKNKLETLLSEKSNATLLYIALTGYDTFKEKEGATFGDGLLIAYSKRVKYNVKGGLVVHLGEEEFVVFLEGSLPDDAIKSVSKRIKELSAQPFSIMGKIATISASVGHSTMPEDSSKFTSLLSIALDRAKG